jgi:hypothetical protein
LPPRSEDPFLILYHHRRASKLRHMRELHKLKIFKRREELRRAADAEKEENINRLNRSMLLDDSDWSIVQEEFRERMSPS